MEDRYGTCFCQNTCTYLRCLGLKADGDGIRDCTQVNDEGWRLGYGTENEMILIDESEDGQRSYHNALYIIQS